MTRQKTFKHRVRDRMTKTGESYTAARRMLIAAGDRPEAGLTPFNPPYPDETVLRATGRDWQAWFGLLDAWGGTSHPHIEIARWLREAHAVSDWWAQSLTVAYEQARGLRAPGQTTEGWAISATKTIEVPVEAVFAAFEDETLRQRWLPGADLRLRTATPPRNTRYDWEDGSSRVVVNCTALSPERSRLAVQHERLPDAETAEEMKLWWRERVAALKPILEQSQATPPPRR